MFTQTRAEVHVRRRQFDEAEVLYWRVIAGHRFLGSDERRLEIQLTLGRVFEMHERPKDAILLFTSTFIEYLDISLSLTLDAPQFLSIHEAVLCLRKSYINSNLDGKWSDVIDKLCVLQESETESLISHHDYHGPTPNFVHGPELVKAAIKLAVAYSDVEEFGIAESIFKLVINSNSESSRNRFNTLTIQDKANACLCYATHCNERGNYKDCFSNLAQAVDNLLHVHIQDFDIGLVDSLKIVLKTARSGLGDILESLKIVPKATKSGLGDGLVFARDLALVKSKQVELLISIVSKIIPCADNEGARRAC